MIVVQVVRELASASEVLGCLPRSRSLARGQSGEGDMPMDHEGMEETASQALGALPFAPPTLHVAHARRAK